MPIGKAKIERAGKDITLVSHSINVGRCLQAAEQLKEKHDVEAEVINIRSAKPLDVECIVNSIKKTNRVVSVDSGFPAFVSPGSPKYTLSFIFQLLMAAFRASGPRLLRWQMSTLSITLMHRLSG